MCAFHFMIAWRRFADEKVKDSLLQIEGEGEKRIDQKKRKAVDSTKLDAKPPQNKRGRTVKTPTKTASKSAVRPTPKSTGRSSKTNLASRLSANDWNDDAGGTSMRVEEEEPYNYDDQFNTSFPEPLHPLDDPELLPAFPLPPPFATHPPPPPLDFETGSKGNREGEQPKRATVSTKKISDGIVLKETTKPPLHPNKSFKPIEKENSLNKPEDQKGIGSKVCMYIRKMFCYHYFTI